MLISALTRTSIRCAFADFNAEKRHTLHRFNFLRRLGLIDKLKGLEFSRACSFRRLREAYALSYRLFLKNNYIKPNFLGMRIREWELNPETATFVVQSQDAIVGCTTLAYPIGDLGLPSEWLYKEEINELMTFSSKINEACNEAVDEQYRSFSIPIEFFRIMLAHSWFTDIDKVTAVVNKNHKTFYEFLYMVQIGEEKSYSEDHYDPVVLMCLDCDLLFDYLSSPESDNGSADSYLRDFLLFKNPYLKLANTWEKKAKAAFKRQRIRERFLDEMRNTLVASVWDGARPEKIAIPPPAR